MAKNKLVPKTNTTFKKVTTAFGYGLFILAVINVVVSVVIPWTTLLLQPYVIKRVNVAVELVAFLFAAILPILIGYILGQKITHRHDRLTQHFNGILFGIVAYWASAILSLAAIDTLTPIRATFSEPFATIVAAWPVVATLAIMSIIAFYYAHNHRQKDSVLQDRIYQLALVVTTLGLPAYELLYLFQSYDSLSLVSTVIQTVLTVGLVILSRSMIHRFQPMQRNPFSLALIAVSIGLITMQLTAQLVSLINPWYLFELVASGVLGLVAWLLFLILIIRKA